MCFSRRFHRAFILPWGPLLFLFLVIAGTGHGQTRLGDAGHFLAYESRIHLYNATGESFTITVSPMRWGHGGWNKAHVKVKIIAPDGEVLTKGKHPLENDRWTFEVRNAEKGVYRVEPSVGWGCYVESSLDRSVLWMGDPDAHPVKGRWSIFMSTVPRRWWFRVPEGVNEFTIRARMAEGYVSQREDWALFIYSPRGQRMKAVVGQPSYRSEKREIRITVPVEPGTAGRFWSIRAGYGDSHNYSDVIFTFEGIPPYLARSPEEWFNPEKDGEPEVPLYDETPFFWTAPDPEMMKTRWPKLEHFSPAPSLGDPDGVQLRGTGRFALWNPEGRKLKFRIGSYLPRKENGEWPEAHVHVAGPEGETVFEGDRPLESAHSKKYHPEVTLDTGKGVSRGTVTGALRWFVYTYPSTPLVMMPRDKNTAVDEWSSFRFTAAAARNWYFYVPEGTETFSLRFDAKYDSDVIHMQICAPNMVRARLYENRTETTIEVPEGLDGKIWYLRPKIGEATHITQDGPPYRFQQSPMTVEIKGVPPYLAPTWEQWFHPDHPRRPLERGTE